VEAAALDLTTYRAAVDDLIRHIDAGPRRRDPAEVESLVCERLTRSEFAQLLAATPSGTDQVIRMVIAEIREFLLGKDRSAADLADLTRVCLLAQIDTLWWGAVPAYHRDAEVEQCADLVDIAGTPIAFRYRLQTDAFARRLVRAAGRRIAPSRIPDPVGLRFARTRPEVVELLNQLSAEFGRKAPAGTPPLWVTSLARSVQHQLRLRSLGYAAMLPSSHCTGYGTDIAMSWYGRYGADRVLSQLLLERREAGQINVISGEQTWHVCLSPHGAGQLRRDLEQRIGG
jgi:hypothetical protein